jgi:protein TonB
MTLADSKPLPLPKIGPSDRLGAVVPVAPALEGADLTNVIVLAHRRGSGEKAPEVSVDENARPAPIWSWATRTPWTALIAAALLLHLGFVLIFMRDPTPMPSLAIDSISVEVVLGGQTEAGTAEAPSSVSSAPSPPSVSAPEEQQVTEEAKVTEQKPIEVAEEVKPDLKPSIETTEPQREETRTEPQLEQAKPEEPQADEPKTATAETQTAAAEPEPARSAEPEPAPSPEPEPAPSAEPEPKPVIAEQKPAPPQAKPEEQKPVEQPIEQPVAHQPPPKPEARPEHKPEPKETARAQSRPSPPRLAAAPSGVGVGSSRDIRNWASRVSAQLARNKRYPAEALSRGIGGTASVTFSLDGDGRVISVRLARSSGNASLDRESQDLVRRAAPFPPPPHGRASITVPINFNVRAAQ